MTFTLVGGHVNHTIWFFANGGKTAAGAFLTYTSFYTSFPHLSWKFQLKIISRDLTSENLYVCAVTTVFKGSIRNFQDLRKGVGFSTCKNYITEFLFQ